ncbi:MAG: serine hydrolase domain-containing protein [Bacillota bacterium]|nr:beta-lactamase family protein [Candidatus Fermentithermobacillaceae bacterium]
MAEVCNRDFDASKFEEFVEGMMEEYEVPGLAVGIIRDGRVIYTKGFGYRDHERKLPVTPDTVFGIASVSKSFTALAIMQLAEKGLLAVEHPVKRYLPEFDLPGTESEHAWKITIHNFLTHTAGIPPLPSLTHSILAATKPDKAGNEVAEKDKEGAEKDKEDAEKAKGVAERSKEDAEKPAGACDRPSILDTGSLLRFMATHDYRLLGAPGEHVSYSNDAFGLLGTIIERVSGQEYEEYLQQHILGPLNMAHTTTKADKLQHFPDVTRLYYKNKDDCLCVSDNWQEAPPLTACGFIKSNVKDLLSYVSMYMNNGVLEGRRVISPAGISRMITPYHPYILDRWYGYGFSIRPDYAGTTLIQHSGSLRGVASNIGYVPEKGIGAVVLSNLTGFPASKVWLGAVNLLLGLPVDHPIVTKELSPQPEQVLLRLAGTYRSGEGANIVVRVKDGKLEAEVDSKIYPVDTTGPDTAVVTIRGTENHVRFLFDSSGEVWALRYGSRLILRSREEDPDGSGGKADEKSEGGNG